MLIDCDTCVAREHACGQCVIGVLLRSPAVPVDLDPDEQAAMGSLAQAGPSLRCGWCAELRAKVAINATPHVA